MFLVLETGGVLFRTFIFKSFTDEEQGGMNRLLWGTEMDSTKISIPVIF